MLTGSERLFADKYRKMSALTTVLVVLAAVVATVAVMMLYQPRTATPDVVIVERGDWWGPWWGPWWVDGGRGAGWPWRPHPRPGPGPHPRPHPGPGHAMLGPGGTRRLVQ